MTDTKEKNVVTQNENKLNKKREYLFDNLKAVLIFLMVFGHFIELNGMKDKSILFRTLWMGIYSFHMPLFIFVAGYFTKYYTENAKKAIKNYLIPFIIFSNLIYFFDVFILKNQKTFELMIPQTSMWFLLTVFFYKIIYNGIYKIKGIFIMSIIYAIIVGFDTSFASTGSLSRIVVFLPFFIAGNKFKKEYLLKITSKKIRYILIILIITLILLFGYITVCLGMPTKAITFKHPYISQGTTLIKAVIFRIFIIVCSLLFCYLILNVIPNHKTIISYIGKSTITVYLLHVFVIKTFEKLDILKEPTFSTLIICLIMSIIVIYITSIPLVKKIYDKIIDKISNVIGI